jgi:sulfur carrier protein ThiS
MRIKLTLALVSASAALVFPALIANLGQAGERVSDYKVLAPLTHGNLTIFPVVMSYSHDAHEFLTLDDGLRSGEVVVTESGRVQPLIRRRPNPVPHGGAEVNRLVLMNNSERPLILLAGEIVTGGKQDRVVGKDRIVAPHGDPIALDVFCVEPGRWVETSDKFDSFHTQMAQPSVRRSAMAEKDQQRVWAKVQESSASLAAALSPESASGLASTSSYAGMMNNVDVKQQVNAMAVPLERSYENVLRELHTRNAIGVVVAVNGQIIWADLFASTPLLEKYWPKLIRSYAAEALTTRAPSGHAGVKSAQAFLQNFAGRRESVETEPGVYKHTEISGEDFKAFELTSLLPGMEFDIHIAKMAE